MSSFIPSFNPVVELATPKKLEKGESQNDFQGRVGADLEKNLDMDYMFRGADAFNRGYTKDWVNKPNYSDRI